MSIIPGEELFSGVVTSEPHFSSLPFFLFLFFWRRKWSRDRVTCMRERDPGGCREGLILLTHLGAPKFPEGSLPGLHVNAPH